MSYRVYLVALVATLALFWVVLRRRSAIRNIPGPPSASWIFGNMLELMMSSRYGDNEFLWRKLYGPVYRFKGCFGEDRLMVSDPLALQYILNSAHFEHSPILDYSVHLLYGMRSVSGAKGESHRRLRAALNVGFSAAAVRDYQPIFEKIAQTLTEQLEQTSGSSINISPLLSTATLGAVSEAVLGYSIQDLGDEFVANNCQLIALVTSQSPSQILADALGSHLPSSIFHAAGHLPTATFNILRKAKALAYHLGHRAVQEKMEAARKGLESTNDVFSQLLHSAQSDTTKKRLSEDDIVAQTALILVAGQDTTANTLAFGLLELARNPELQVELRTEIHAALGNGRRNAAYDSMPLLNAFIKEALRVYPALAVEDRIAVSDAVIPLAEGMTTSAGEHLTQIPVRKGQIVTLGIASFQRLESYWGADADEFKPARWVGKTPYQGDAVGPYANLLSFLGGPRTCLGWRFALLEMQVLICELVGKFSFSLPKNNPVQPRLVGTLVPTMTNGQKGAPLCVERIV